VINVGTWAVRPTKVKGNPFTVAIRLGSVWDGMPGNDCMGSMIAVNNHTAQPASHNWPILINEYVRGPGTM
jgi:hypothetical protein